MIQQVSVSTAALVALLAGAGGYALGHATSSPAPSDPVHEATADRAPTNEDDLPPNHPPMGDMNGGDMSGNDLPPDHPSVQGMGGNPNGPSEPADDEASLTWTAPPRWKSAPNPSSMRLATYVIPRAAGDAADGDLSITRAGGDIDANVDRWLGQFDESARASAKRTKKDVHGLKVTVVEIYGTYSGGMGPNAGPQPSWGLLGAIVEAEGLPYFFKITGPAKTVQGARAELDQLLGSLAKKS